MLAPILANIEEARALANLAVCVILVHAADGLVDSLAAHKIPS